MQDLEALVDSIVKEALTWSQESPNDLWYRDRIFLLIHSAFDLQKERSNKLINALEDIAVLESDAYCSQGTIEEAAKIANKAIAEFDKGSK